MMLTLTGYRFIGSRDGLGLPRPFAFSLGTRQGTSVLFPKLPRTCYAACSVNLAEAQSATTTQNALRVSFAAAWAAS